MRWPRPSRSREKSADPMAMLASIAAYVEAIGIAVNVGVVLSEPRAARYVSVAAATMPSHAGHRSSGDATPPG